jgi:hypothetical protein
VYDKYGVVAWYREENSETHSSSKIEEVELLDLEARTLVRQYGKENLLRTTSGYLFCGFTGYEYTKFDVNKEPPFELTFNQSDYGYRAWVRNWHPRSPYLCAYLQSWNTFELRVIVVDLRTGGEVHNEVYLGEEEMCTVLLYDTTIFVQKYRERHILKVDVLTKEQELFPFPECKFGVIGDDVWGTADNKLFKYSLTKKTMEHKKHTVGSESYDICFALGFVILVARASLEFKDPIDGRHLGTVFFEGYENPSITELPNGTLALLTMRSLQVLSFKSEDVNRPMELLQLSVDGRSQVLRVNEGDVYHKYWSSNIPAMSSEFIYETETERYSMVFCFLEVAPPNMPARKLLSNAKTLSPSYRSKIYTRVLINAKVEHGYVHSGLERSRTACGDVWLVYEQFIDGRWCKSKPVDSWQFILDRVSINE